MGAFDETLGPATVNKAWDRVLLWDDESQNKFHKIGRQIDLVPSGPPESMGALFCQTNRVGE